MGRLRSPGSPGVLAVLAAAVAAGCATAPTVPPVPTLEHRVDALIDAPPFDGVQWGVLLVDPERGEVLYERNADRRFIPASNLKIPVAVAALGLLGPDFRWSTTFHATTPPRMGVLDGDLHLRGTGDPTLGAPFFDDSGQALDALVDSLRTVGVSEVAGGLVLDASAWDSTSVPGTWMVGDLAHAYSATGGAFAVGGGELVVRVRGGEHPGDPGLVEWTPRGRSVFVEGEVRTVAVGTPGEIELAYLPETRRWSISGTVEAGRVRTHVLAARDPVRLGLDALAAALDEGGVVVRGATRIVWDAPPALEDGCPGGGIDGCPRMLPIAGRYSPPLSDVVAEILGASQNWMAEQLVRTVGVERGGTGSWEDGLAEIREFLEREVGLDSLDLHFRDGSGLSVHNLATPRALVSTLGYARATWGPSFFALLPAPGRANTTLEERFSGMEGRVFAKTGTMSHVNALSGYVLTDDGRELVFSILTNASNLPGQDIRDRIDAVVRELGSPGR